MDLGTLAGTIQHNIWLLSFFGGTSLVLAGLSAYYAIRQANHDLQRQSQMGQSIYRSMQSVFGWFQKNGVVLLFIIAMFFVAIVLGVIAIAVFKPFSAQNPDAASTATAQGQTATDTADVTKEITVIITDTPTPLPVIEALPVIEVSNPNQTPIPTVLLLPTETIEIATKIPKPDVTFQADTSPLDVGGCTNLNWNVIAHAIGEIKTILATGEVIPFDGNNKEKSGGYTTCITDQPEPNQRYIRHDLIIEMVDGQIFTTTSDILIQPTPVSTPTPNAPYIRFKDGIKSVPLYRNPVKGAKVADLTDGPLIARLQIDAQTSDGVWYRVCCFTLPDSDDVPLWFEGWGIVENQKAVQNIQPVVAPTPEPQMNFERSRGPEFTTTTDENFLTIYAKIFNGDNLAQQGYMLAMRFQSKGQSGWSNRRNVRSAADGSFEATSDSGYSISPFGEYNYKYEYRAPEGKLGEGTWEFWLTNAQEVPLSKKESLSIAANDPYRIIYIAWKQVR